MLGSKLTRLSSGSIEETKGSESPAIGVGLSDGVGEGDGVVDALGVDVA
jgi:hypothetical protein